MLCENKIDISEAHTRILKIFVQYSFKNNKYCTFIPYPNDFGLHVS